MCSRFYLPDTNWSLLTMARVTHCAQRCTPIDALSQQLHGVAQAGAHLCGRPDASRSVVVGSVHAPNVDGLERFRRQLRTKGMESASLSAASHSARGRQPVSQTYAYRAAGSRDGWRRVVYRVAGDQRRVVASGADLMVVSEGNGKDAPEGVGLSGAGASVA